MTATFTRFPTSFTGFFESKTHRSRAAQPAQNIEGSALTLGPHETLSAAELFLGRIHRVAELSALLEFTQLENVHYCSSLLICYALIGDVQIRMHGIGMGTGLERDINSSTPLRCIGTDHDKYIL